MSISDSNPLRDTRSRKWRVALGPFKAYVVGAFAVLLLAMFLSPLDPYKEDARRWLRSIARAVYYGYLVSLIVFLIAALDAAFYTHDKPTVWSSLAYAVVGFVITGFVYSVAFPVLLK